MPHKKVNDQSETGWARALTDARQQLEAAKNRVLELRLAVRVCEERVNAGEPFPGEQG